MSGEQRDQRQRFAQQVGLLTDRDLSHGSDREDNRAGPAGAPEPTHRQPIERPRRDRHARDLHQRDAGEPADRREQHRVVEGPVAAVPAAVPQREPAPREHLHAIGGGGKVRALGPGENCERSETGGEQRRE